MSRVNLIKKGLKQISKVPGAVKKIAQAQRAGKTPTGGRGAKGRKFRRNAAKVGAGAAAGAAAVSIPTKKPKSKTQKPLVSRDGKGPLRSKPGDRGAGTRDKPLKLSQVMNKKGTVYSGKLGEFMKKRNEPGAKSKTQEMIEKRRREGKMGGGMMKKRMKRGGRAMKRGGGMMKKRMKRGGRAK